MIDFTTSVDSWGQVTNHLDIGGRVGESEKFGYRINAVSSCGPTFIDDSYLQRYFFSSAIDYRFSDKTVLTGFFDITDHNTRRTSYQGIDLTSNGQLPTGIGPEDGWAQDWEYYRILKYTVGADLKSEINNQLTFYASVFYSADREDGRLIDAYNFQPNGNFDQYFTVFGYDFASITSTSYLQYKFETGQIRHKVIGGFMVTGGYGDYLEPPGSQTLPTRATSSRCFLTPRRHN